MTQGKEDKKKKVYRRPFLLRGKEDTKVKKEISMLMIVHTALQVNDH